MIYLSKHKNKYAIILLCNVLGLNLLFAAELQIGSQIPEINHKLNDVSGKQITLAEVKGNKGILVIFSCNTCPWVLKWEKRYVDISKQYKDKGIGIIAVNSNVSRFDSDDSLETVSYTHLRAHETPEHLVCRLLLEKKKIKFTLNRQLKFQE